MKKESREFLVTRKQAYQGTFTGIKGEKVLADLAKFCRANKSTFSHDARVSALLEGRREVFLRIADHLNMSIEDLENLYNKG